MSAKKGKMTFAELSNFCGQVALILESGLLLQDGMETISSASEDSDEEDILRCVERNVAETGSLYRALKDDERWPRYMAEMTGIGEESGHLENVMRGLEHYYAREQRVRNSLIHAVTYPVVLGAMLVLIIGVLLWYVMPVFRRMLNSMGIALSGTGRALARFGTGFGWAAAVMVLLIIICIVAIVLLLRTSKREAVLAALERRLPLMRRLKRNISASRIAAVLSLLLSSGYPAEDALDMADVVLDDAVAAEKIRGVREKLRSGMKFSEVISESEIFGKLHNSMIRVGAATGHEDQIFLKLAAIYEEETEEEIDRLLGIVEPSLIAVLAVVIGAVLLSVLLPMAGILSSL